MVDMTALQFPARLIVAAGCALAIAMPVAASMATAPASVPSPLALCSGGEESDAFTGTCVPYLVPTSPAGNNLCPPGVTGAECTLSTGNEAGPSEPQLPAPAVGQGPEQQLQDVSTPNF